MSRISSTAGRSVSMASSGGCSRARSSRQRTRSTSVTTPACSGSTSVSVRPEPLLARRRLDEAGHRPARLGHDVGERGVADVELPQRRAGAGARRPVAVQRQPGDQLQRLRPLEARRPARRASTTSTGPSRRTSSDHGTRAARRVRLVDRRRAASTSRSASARVGVLADQRLVGLARARRAAPSTSPRRQPDRHERRCPSGSSTQRPGAGPQRPRRAGRVAGDDDGQAAAGGGPPTRTTLGGHLAGGRRGGEHDRRLPRLAAGVPGPQHERALLRRGGGADERGRQLERVVDRRRRRGPGGGRGTTVLVEPDADEVGDLGEDRRGQRGGDAADHGVGRLGRRHDAEHAQRLEVGEHLAAVGVDAELGQRDARRTDRAGGLGEQLDRRRARQLPAPRPAPSHGAGSAASPVSTSSTAPSVPTRTTATWASVVDERGGGRPHGDVDPQQPLAGVDGAQPALGGHGLGRRLGHPGPGLRRPQAMAATRREQGQHAGRQQGRLADPDRRRRRRARRR